MSLLGNSAEEILLGLFLTILCVLRTDSTVTGWTMPSITGKTGSGSLTVAENKAAGYTVATLACTATSPTYAIASQPPDNKLEINTAALNIATGKSFDFETGPTYVLEVTCTDSDNDVGTATITVSVTDVNEAPMFANSLVGATVADGSTAGTTVTSVTATDEDTGDTVTYSIASGNTNNDFTIDSTDGVIKVATGKTLHKSTTLIYQLSVEAADNDASPKTGTVQVVVAVTTCGASAVAVGVMTLALVAISMFV